MYIGSLRVEFMVPGSGGLKEKRKPLRSLKDRLRHRFNCAVAEVDTQDKWQRVTVGVALVAGEEGELRKQMAEVRRALELDPELQFLSASEEVRAHDGDPFAGL